MSLREDVELYTKLSGEDGSQETIGTIGAYLRGYRQGKADAEPHWIPVTERLPKSKEEDLEYPTVLICFENEEVMLGCFYESTKEWVTGEYFDKKCNPIAWMPLPEPYKGVTE